MADTKQSDFCCDTESIDSLSKSYDKIFEELSIHKTNIETAINATTAMGKLKGKWYHSFLEDYQKWNVEYNRMLASQILLTACLQQMRDSANYLIQERDALSNHLPKE